MNTIATRTTSLLSVLLIGLFLSATFPLSVDAASTRPSIKLTAPSNKSSFGKEGAGAIPLAWAAQNVPEDTLIILELKHKKLAKGGGGVGGGTWQDEIIAGDSTGSYNWDIEGEGNAGPGTYKVRALLQQCVSGDCNANPFFPGTKKTKTYAKSKWVNLTITKGAANESEEASKIIGARPNGTVAVYLAMNGSTADFFELSSDSELTVTYHPSGDVQSCTGTAYYEGGKQDVTHGWKNGVAAGQYGQFSFKAVAPYPLKSLKSVEVVCGNAMYRASDTIRFSVDSSAVESDFKILVGKTGKTVHKKGVDTKAVAEAYCQQAFNDSAIHKNTRVQCYWDGEKFEDISQFKG